MFQTRLPRLRQVDAARVALTGRTASPGLYEVIEALGKERAVGRLTNPARG